MQFEPTRPERGRGFARHAVQTSTALALPLLLAAVLGLWRGQRQPQQGGDTEDALVDGLGDDVASAGGGDDAVPNNAGDDDLHAGSGEDLFVSDSICEGDALDGGPDRDNANWANFDFPIVIDMEANRADSPPAGGQPECASTPLFTSLTAITPSASWQSTAPVTVTGRQP